MSAFIFTVAYHPFFWLSILCYHVGQIEEGWSRNSRDLIGVIMGIFKSYKFWTFIFAAMLVRQKGGQAIILFE